MEKITRKIGRNRGKPRLWIEGASLVAAGFSRGDRWALVPTDNGFNIHGRADGDRKVSGKLDKPIIDIAGSSLGDLGNVERVTIVYEPMRQLMQVRSAEGSNS